LSSLKNKPNLFPQLELTLKHRASHHVQLGLAAVTRFVSLVALENSLESNVPPKTIEQNRAALKKGCQVGRFLKNTPEKHD